MPAALRVCTVLAGALLAGSVSPAGAQIYEAAGTRAQGLGGAFVAVADDATATWWNPAGLATGAFVSLTVEQVRLEGPAGASPDEAAWRTRSRGFAVAYPALGLSHYRLRVSEIAQPIAGAQPDRQEGETASGRMVRSLAANQFGVTVGQSIGDHLVVASTLKLVRGGVISSTTGGPELLDHAEEMDVPLHTRADLDLGVMASVGSARVGLSIRHLREPAFGSGVDRLTLHRQARMGVAVLGDWGDTALTAAFDADLTRTATEAGDVRRVAAGVEAWLFDRWLGVRGGVGANSAGEGGYSASGGLSVGLQRGLYLEGAATVGSDQALTGWAVGLGVAY
jgi:hypothetical protein